MSGGLSSERELIVDWGDCDASGLVFYPRYYEWMDANTHALLSRVGLDHRTLRQVHGVLGTPLVQTTARYASPATFGDVLMAQSRVVRVGRSSFTVEHRFHAGERLVVEGEEVRVWALGYSDDAPFPRAVPIPDAVRALLWPTPDPLSEAAAPEAGTREGR